MANNDWNPPAPDMNSEFKEASRNTAEEPTREIVTAEERDRYQAALDDLQATRSETRQGTADELIDDHVEEELRTRLEEMNERLESKQLRKNFNSSS